jgi:hypothetical protein
MHKYDEPINVRVVDDYDIYAQPEGDPVWGCIAVTLIVLAILVHILGI